MAAAVQQRDIIYNLPDQALIKQVIKDKIIQIIESLAKDTGSYYHLSILSAPEEVLSQFKDVSAITALVELSVKMINLIGASEYIDDLITDIAIIAVQQVFEVTSDHMAMILGRAQNEGDTLEEKKIKEALTKFNRIIFDCLSKAPFIHPIEIKHEMDRVLTEAVTQLNPKLLSQMSLNPEITTELMKYVVKGSFAKDKDAIELKRLLDELILNGLTSYDVLLQAFSNFGSTNETMIEFLLARYYGASKQLNLDWDDKSVKPPCEDLLLETEAGSLERRLHYATMAIMVMPTLHYYIIATAKVKGIDLKSKGEEFEKTLRRTLYLAAMQVRITNDIGTQLAVPDRFPDEYRQFMKVLDEESLNHQASFKALLLEVIKSMKNMGCSNVTSRLEKDIVNNEQNVLIEDLLDLPRDSAISLFKARLEKLQGIYMSNNAKLLQLTQEMNPILGDEVFQKLILGFVKFHVEMYSKGKDYANLQK